MDGMGGERLGEAELRKGAEGGGTGANFSEAALHTIRSAYATRHMPCTCRTPRATHVSRLPPRPAPARVGVGWSEARGEGREMGGRSCGWKDVREDRCMERAKGRRGEEDRHRAPHAQEQECKTLATRSPRVSTEGGRGGKQLLTSALTPLHAAYLPPCDCCTYMYGACLHMHGT